MSEQERRALADALRAEHAAVYAYGVVAAFILAPRKDAVAAATAAHEVRRDAVNGALVAAGAIAPVSEPGYLMPLAVTDPVTATQLAVIVETDTAVAWRSVLERSDPSTEGVPAGSFDVRATAVAGLSDCAVRATGWRVALGTVPATTAFPGMPTPTGG